MTGISKCTASLTTITQKSKRGRLIHQLPQRIRARGRPEIDRNHLITAVIIGGGPAGCGTALALQQLGIQDVLIVEAGQYEAIRVGETVPPDIRLLLAQLGIEEAFLREGHEPCLGSCAAWGSSRLGFNDFIANPHGHGWHLDRRKFDMFLANEAKRHGARVLTGTRFDRAEPMEDGRMAVVLRDTSGTPITVRTRFVVDASGTRAAVARRLGARRRYLDKLVGVTGLVSLPEDKAFSQLTMLEAVEYGWWYAAKVPGKRVAVVVASDPKLVSQRGLHLLNRWKQELSQTLHLSLEFPQPTLSPDKPIIVPVSSDLLYPMVGTNWMAVGDAASSYDPISSQGIYKAISNGVDAARAITRYFAGEHDALSNYEKTVRNQFSEYVKNRNYFYSMEGRWRDSEFWSRRRHDTEHFHERGLSV